MAVTTIFGLATGAVGVAVTTETMYNQDVNVEGKNAGVAGMIMTLQ